MFAPLAFAALFALPTTAFSAFVEKWHTTPPASYRVLNTGGDLYGNGVYEIITAEVAGGGNERIALRSASTGAVLAQTVLSTYRVGEVWLEDVDGDGHSEIIFMDTVTGKLNCLNYAGTNTLPVRWSFVASANWLFANLDNNNTAETITVEPGVGGFQQVVVRAAATGSVVAQTTQTSPPYNVGQLSVVDLDNDGLAEILFWDASAHKMNCLAFTPGPNTLAVRWSYPAYPNWTLVDFDGNSHLYLVFQESVSDPSYFIYDRNGTNVSTFHPSGAPFGNGWVAYMRPDDYDGDGRQELLLDYQYGPAPGNDVLYVYESNSPVSVEATNGPRALELRASFPNPASSESRIAYNVPSTGSASLRLFDVNGREVRTLVHGTTQAGQHEAIWDGRDDRGLRLPAGAYFYELNAGGQRVTRRVIRLQ